MTSSVARDSPPSAPLEARLRIKTPRSVLRSCIRTRSPSRAPPVNGEVGSTATMPTVLSCRRYSWANWPTKVLLPDPGAPVIPTICAWPVWGWINFIISEERAALFSTSVINFPIARRFPFNDLVTKSIVLESVTNLFCSSSDFGSL